MRHTAGYSLLDDTRNGDTLQDPVEKKLAQHKQKCLNSVRRMEDIRYPKQFLDYRSIGKRPG